MSGKRPLGERLGGEWPQIADVLDTLAEAITIRGRSGEVVFANRAAVESMGFSSLQEMLERGSRSIMDEYYVEDEHGRPLSFDDIPSIRMMAGEEVRPVMMRIVHRETGEMGWRQLKASPLLDEGGELQAVVTVIEDVTPVKTAEMRVGVLAESGRILASSLDYEETLSNIARVAVPALADWCAVDLVDESLHRETVALAHQDPEKIELAHRVRAFEPNQLTEEEAAVRVMRTGRSELYPDVSAEMLEQGARSPEHLELIRELNLKSVLMVPLQVPGRAIGVLTLGTAESRRRLDEDDLELAEQLGRRAAVAVENARLHTTLADIAQTLQQSLLPDELPEVPGWEVAALFQPAGGPQRVDVGGDFYELFGTEIGWFAMIGDVTGKGVRAAALTSLLRHGARFAGRYEPAPAGILAQVDHALRQRSDDSLCTALCLRLRRGEAVISSAGHPPALHITPEGAHERPHHPGPLLGAFEGADWPQETIEVGPEDMLLLYTDGVTETVGEHDRYGVERLRALTRAHRSDSPGELLSAIAAALAEFRSGSHEDDVAMLALRPRR